MFTGLIQQIGKVKAFNGHELVIEGDFPAGEVAVGDSIAVNGCCQTAVALGKSEVRFHVLDESRNVTNLKFLKPGDSVNLELAMKLGDRLGGHIVSGHIDCTARIMKISEMGDDIQVEVERPPVVSFPMIHRGSVAINGISLTVARLEEKSFAVRIIPHTWENTNLKYCKAGTFVNLEADVIGKYAAGLLSPYAPAGKVTMDMLRDAGF